MEISLSKQTVIGGVWALVALFAASTLIVVTAYRLDRLLYATYIQEVRSDTYLELVEVREAFGKVIQSQSLALRELATFIGDNPNISQDEFSRRAQSIRGVDESMISIAGAPNMVITLIDPLEGNQGALGLDYRKTENQFPAIQRMMTAGNELITGPINLAQGGTGLILRAPVYLRNPDGFVDEDTGGGGPKLWGIVSLVLDYGQFLERTGITKAAQKYDLFIEIAQHLGDDTDANLYGDRVSVGEDAVTLHFDFALESWVMHAVTKGGWPRTSPDQWRQRIIIGMASFLLLGTLVYILRLSHTRKRAKLLLNSGIEALNDGFVMFDADDRLILSNTKYRDIYDLPKEVLRPGTPYFTVFTAWLEKQAPPPAEIDVSNWIDDRQAKRRVGEKLDMDHHLADGRVIKTSNHPLKDGGIVGLRVDVTELTRAKLAAEAASKAKTDFMGVLSHELRTPLTVIMGVARLSENARLLRSSKALIAAYEEGDVPRAQAKAMLDDIFVQLGGLLQRLVQSGEHLEHLINELLDVAKIESGSLTFEPTICNIKDIVDPVFQQLSTLSRKKGLDFEVVQEVETVFADKMRVRQILINLVGNAIKFTDRGFVRLYVKEHADMVRFEIYDSGEGISETEFDSIFDVFYQVDSTATRRAGGTGMGLAISRSLAQLQGGSLTVSSVVGKGSCFVLTLPLTKQHN
ncbi:ATP-binding protein [Pseudorhodobacter sp. W20_MBD10_FR17]|uniref:ATP-binding protein n=1 Tax=Pseudorhodobacter sp. W20_MBD10_FR17 TaxID=3240266 RepID=UPI003F97AEDD